MPYERERGLGGLTEQERELYESMSIGQLIAVRKPRLMFSSDWEPHSTFIGEELVRKMRVALRELEEREKGAIG